jgi:hypothetical protein
MDQLLGPDTGRVFNDASAEVAAGNLSAEKAAKTIEQSWQQNKDVAFCLVAAWRLAGVCSCAS